MNYWDVLGIGPEADAAEIKRAYASTLKDHHPEDDPEGFQRVRQAYEHALRYAKHAAAAAPIKVAPAAEENDFVYGTHTLQKDVCRPLPKRTQTSEMLVKQFMHEADTIFARPCLRKDVTQWQTLLENEVYWQLDIREQLQYCLLDRLLRHYRLSIYRLPQPVWRLFNEHFFWTDHQLKVYAILPADFVDYVMENIYGKQLDLRCKAIDFAKTLFIRVSAVLDLVMHGAAKAALFLAETAWFLLTLLWLLLILFGKDALRLVDYF